MDSWFTENKKPILQSLGVFLGLFGIIVLLALYYDFSRIDLGGLLFLSSFLTCLFIAKNTYDTAKSDFYSKEMKKSMSADLSVSTEELYIQLYKNSPVPYMIIDYAGKIKSANIAAVRMLGEKQNKIKTVNIFDRVESTETGHIDFLVEKYQNSIPVSAETVKVKKPNLQESWVLLSLFAFNDEMGERIGLLTLVDITRQKKAEDAKSEFVSLASHQLRTPIAGMKWSAELLLMDNPEDLTARQRKYIDRLLISIQRLAVLIDDFLRVSRFELGTFQAEYLEASLPELFEDIISEQEAMVTNKKITVKKSFDSKINRIVTDPNLLRMIVTNIYSNAVKYTRENGTVHIGYSYKDEELNIIIADNGMGIPAEDQTEIFSKLFRASNAVRDVPNGTGLGLYIVKEAVSVLKGKITFSATENVGTTFEVVLPLRENNIKD